MSQFSAAGVAPNGTPVNVLFGWDFVVGLYVDVYDPSLSEDFPFVEYYPKSWVEFAAVLNKHKINGHRAAPERIDKWPEAEREHWEELE